MECILICLSIQQSLDLKPIQIVHVFLDAKFIITYIDTRDTTFIHDKHFDVHTEGDYISKDEL